MNDKIIILGGGISGIASSYELNKNNIKSIILEEFFVGWFA